MTAKQESFFTGKDFIHLPLPTPGEYDSLDVIAMRANAIHEERCPYKLRCAVAVGMGNDIVTAYEKTKGENARLREALKRLFDEVNGADHWLRQTETFEAVRAVLKGK